MIQNECRDCPAWERAADGYGKCAVSGCSTREDYFCGWPRKAARLCRDCRYFEPCYGGADACRRTGAQTTAADFCSRAEPKRDWPSRAEKRRRRQTEKQEGEQ